MFLEQLFSSKCSKRWSIKKLILMGAFGSLKKAYYGCIRYISSFSEDIILDFTLNFRYNFIFVGKSL